MDGSGAKVVVGCSEMVVVFVCCSLAPPWWSFLTPLYEYLKLCVYVYIYIIYSAIIIVKFSKIILMSKNI